MPKQNRPRLLIVDDDSLIRDTLAFTLSAEYEISLAADRSQAIAVTHASASPHLVLLDLGLPPSPHRADEGFALIREILAHDPTSKIIVLSGQNEEAHARHARTLGALEFIPKPASPSLISETLKKALLLQKKEQNERTHPSTSNRLLGKHPLIEHVRQELQSFAHTPFPVLIEGESGTGKEAAALSLHELSPRANKPFLALNCAALSNTLIEATLFGHARGAFTGASQAQQGYFEAADEGSLFLDEIGELPLQLQPKLLRVLETGEYQRLGETRTRRTNTRIIAATNRKLRQEVHAGNFRADLFHRLSVLRISMPALRSLEADQLELFEYFQHEIAKQLRVKPIQLTPSALACLLNYSFPGNVRELRNLAARLLCRYPGQEVNRPNLEAELEIDTPPGRPPTETLENTEQFEPRHQQTAPSRTLEQILRQTEREHITAALENTNGNMAKAARLLGMNRSTLYSRIENLNRAHSPHSSALEPIENQTPCTKNTSV